MLVVIAIRLIENGITDMSRNKNSLTCLPYLAGNADTIRQKGRSALIILVLWHDLSHTFLYFYSPDKLHLTVCFHLA